MSICELRPGCALHQGGVVRALTDTPARKATLIQIDDLHLAANKMGRGRRKILDFHLGMSAAQYAAKGPPVHHRLDPVRHRLEMTLDEGARTWRT